MRGVLADGSEIELSKVDGGYAGHLRDGLASWRETGQPCYADWPILLSVDGKALWAKPAYPSDTNPDFGVAEASVSNPDPPRSAMLASGLTVEVILDGDGYVGALGCGGCVGRWRLDGTVATDDTPSPIVSIDGVSTQIVADGWCAASLPSLPASPLDGPHGWVFDGSPVGNADRMFAGSDGATSSSEIQDGGTSEHTPIPVPTGTSRRREILERIASCVCRDRQNTYGDAEDNFKNIAAYWNLWLRQRGLLAPGKEIDPLDVAQMSAFIKVARKVGNLDYLDNWVDGGGYEVCGAGIVLSREGSKS